MKKQIISGLVGVAALLMLSVTTSQAYTYGTECTSGTITKVGSVYLAASDGAPKAGMYRSLEITCSDSGWTNGSSFVLYPNLDNDGMLATALTAWAEGNTVEFVVYPYGSLKALLGIFAK